MSTVNRMQAALAALLCAVAVSVALPAALPGAAYAEHLTGGDGWTVTFDSSGQLKDNFSSNKIADEVGDLQPGDDITLSVALKHDNEKAGDWYMANSVVKALEDGDAAGGAYGYKLVYTAPSGIESTLYDSESVGGEDAPGLKEATGALADFFYLDTLEQGQTAKVELTVSLDGETEGNAYFDTLAELNMKFAVQIDSEASSSSSSSASSSSSTSTTTPPATSTPPSGGSSANSSRNPVQTGDNANLFPYFVAMAASGAVLLAIALYSFALRRKDREEGSR